jgi:uncharacterized repeat protein (TIGR01451 family)
MNTLKLSRAGAVLSGVFVCATTAMAGMAGAALAASPQAVELIQVQFHDEIKGAAPERPNAGAAHSAAVPAAPLGAGQAGEVEPNGTPASATALAGTQGVARGNITPNGDVDFYAISAQAGDRLYAAVMTSFSVAGTGGTDSQLRLFAPDGTTLIEFDDDDGSFAALSSSIAGATLPAAGTYYLQVNNFSATAQIRPYELHYRLQRGAPTPEVEPNDSSATATPLPANGWVSGSRSPAAATEVDYYSIALNAGDTVYVSLDLDPERDAVQWNGRLGFGLFGDAGNQILVADDASAGSAANPLSEAIFVTVKQAGTYFAYVDSATAATGGPTATYDLSVTVHPAVDEGVNCTTYTSTNVPQTIGPAAGLVSSTITVPGNPRIADLDVSIQLNHALMQDLDVQLRSPSGNDNPLFNDIGAAAAGGQSQMDTTFDDEAGLTPNFTALRGLVVKPEAAYRLSWFDGEDAGGTWTLDIRDDTSNTSGGTLTGWSMRICEPAPVPACPIGTTPTTVYGTDFEADAGGFTSSGTANEWERGLPATAATATANPIAAFNTCASGSNCFKTDLDNTYDASSNQDLLSPNIDLSGLSGPVIVRWAQRYQMESATFDHYHVDFRQVGGGVSTRLYEWLDGTMTAAIGNPVQNVPAASGWSQRSVRADALAGLNAELLFHLDGDSSVSFAGVAIDDVSVTACRAVSADLSITKSDGVTTAVPGGSVTYTITASNAGPDPVSGATVADTFPAICTASWTCVGAGGGTCTASGSGDINDSVDLPAGGSVTYTATCAISAAASGMLINTATVASTVTDPNAANNAATDTDTLTPQADLAITKTDGVASAVAGSTTVYTIVASNAGPSDVVGGTVADTFPAACTGTWTCVGAGGGSCPASGTGNINDPVSLPAGGSVTYTATCAISAAASGTLSNTATVSSAVTDPNAANNAATDTNTLVQQADLAITKTDGVASVVAGSATVYTIVASNAGPSDAASGTVADTAPAACTSFAWTCVGAGGGSCTASGNSNINDTVNLPAGGSVTYSATCAISAAATGMLTNTATVSSAVADPTPGNNAATDSNTLLAPGTLSVAPSSLGFGTVAVGSTSAALETTVSNTGGSPLTVDSVTAAAAPFAAAGGSCGAAPFTVPAGGSCTLSYTFAPTTGGAANQTLTIDAGASGSASLALSGTGAAGVLGVLNPSIGFGALTVGSSGVQTLTLQNTGGGPLQISAITAATAPFAQIAGGTCSALPITLAAGTSCTIQYRFSPTAIGSFSQVLTITSTGGSATATLAGTGGAVAVQVPGPGPLGLLVLVGLVLLMAQWNVSRRG